ncbi:hypothetical protein JCM10914A_44260 [Paenibacillus sp. JCM 10914]|uniref:aminoglycoside phosphotransferase family protein n=1 Tax=Paenibacillus sp. JCM 10914 TaxID=1236974 RepID=UPI0003CC87DD|nr:aminoglycoside phosphotransferase family protein [Paenibacillus sp. JCM 10914]GAE07460.1 streptomycin 6-kinase [Paenibacillus sp. JCM 10914]
MNKHYEFKRDEMEQFIQRFGEDLYEQVQRVLDIYAEKWKLSAFDFIPSYSANLVFTCHAEEYGYAVLKVSGVASDSIHTEYHTLREYSGGRFCQVYEADLAAGIMLEEGIQPGDALRAEASLDARLSVFSHLYRDMHNKPANADIYPTYMHWVDNITAYMGTRADCAELHQYMLRANEVCRSVSAQYSNNVLLHGDFHHDNILRANDGTYKIIDPKGVIGDPVWDVPRFILNEFEDDITPALYEKISYIINVLEGSLHVPNEVIKRCLFVETAMGSCWSVEDGATPKECNALLERVVFAAKLAGEL